MTIHVQKQLISYQYSINWLFSYGQSRCFLQRSVHKIRHANPEQPSECYLTIISQDLNKNRHTRDSSDPWAVGQYCTNIRSVNLPRKHSKVGRRLVADEGVVGVGRREPRQRTGSIVRMAHRKQMVVSGAESGREASGRRADARGWHFGRRGPVVFVARFARGRLRSAEDARDAERGVLRVARGSQRGLAHIEQVAVLGRLVEQVGGVGAAAGALELEVFLGHDGYFDLGFAGHRFITPDVVRGSCTCPALFHNQTLTWSLANEPNRASQSASECSHSGPARH